MSNPVQYQYPQYNYRPRAGNQGQAAYMADPTGTTGTGYYATTPGGQRQAAAAPPAYDDQNRGDYQTATGQQEGYDYRDGDSTQDYVQRNLFSGANMRQVASNPEVMSLSVRGVGQGIGSYSAFRKGRAAADGARIIAAQQAEGRRQSELRGSLDPRIQQEFDRRSQAGMAPISAQEAEMYRQQLQTQDAQQKMAGQVDDYFKSPVRANTQQQYVDAYRTNSMGDLARQYQTAFQKSAAGTSDQGLLGSSVDNQRRGDLDRAQTAAAQGVEQSATGMQQGFQQGDMQQRQNLMNLIYSQNPEDTASAGSAISGLNQRTQGLDQQYAQYFQNQDVNHFGNQLQSQAVGQTFNGLAGAAHQYGYGSY